MSDPNPINPDHAPYCDDQGWLLPSEQWPEAAHPDHRPGAEQAQKGTT